MNFNPVKRFNRHNEKQFFKKKTYRKKSFGTFEKYILCRIFCFIKQNVAVFL